MAKGTFGERLKRERELREVTPEEVCKATRIAPRFLEALENEQWDRLPGGVFGRGFVRSIARYLGLSEEDLLSEYDLARGESGNGALAKAEERIPVPPKWIPILAGVLAVSVLVALALGGRYAWKAYQAHRAAKKTSAIVSIPRGTQPRTIGVSALGGRGAGNDSGHDQPGFIGFGEGAYPRAGRGGRHGDAGYGDGSQGKPALCRDGPV